DRRRGREGTVRTCARRARRAGALPEGDRRLARARPRAHASLSGGDGAPALRRHQPPLRRRLAPRHRGAADPRRSRPPRHRHRLLQRGAARGRARNATEVGASKLWYAVPMRTARVWAVLLVIIVLAWPAWAGAQGTSEADAHYRSAVALKEQGKTDE